MAIATRTPMPTQTVFSSQTSSLPPLTTPWSYAPECSSQWYFVPESSWLIRDDHISGYSECQPPQVQWDTSAANVPTLSPGVCPVGYTINRITTSSTKTKGLCCLEGFTASQWLICTSSLTSETWNISLLASYGGSTLITTDTFVTRASVMHLALSVYWNEQEVSNLLPWTPAAGPTGARRLSNSSPLPTLEKNLFFYLMTTFMWTLIFSL